MTMKSVITFEERYEGEIFSIYDIIELMYYLFRTKIIRKMNTFMLGIAKCYRQMRLWIERIKKYDKKEHTK